MENLIESRYLKDDRNSNPAISISSNNGNSLINAGINKEYTIKSIKTENTEMLDFLSTLGCYPGGKISVISVFTNNYVIAVNDVRYSIDSELSECIII